MPTATNYLPAKDLSTRVCDLSLEEFLNLAKPIVMSWVGENKQKNTPLIIDTNEYGYGMQAIMELVAGSYSKACRIKKSGIIDEAISQNGRKIIVNMTLARKILHDKTPRL